MAGGKIYVCSGAVLKCTFGTSNGSLVATPKMVSLCGQQQANIADHVSMVNVRPFGRCRSLAYPPTAGATAAHHGHLTPMPCVPGTPARWSIVDVNSRVCGQPALLNTARLRCVFGGTISIINPGQTLEVTGAQPIDIKEREITVSDFFWTGDDANQSRGLALHTSLEEGSTLLVRLGSKVYPTVVGKQGRAVVRNVDASEVSADIAARPAEKPKPAEKPETPPKAKPADTGTVNTTTIPPATDSGWGDPVANPRIRRNSPRHLFGKVRRDANGNPRNHQGFDYYAPVGTPIMSVGDGVIHTIQKGHSSYGLNVTIKHSRGNGVVYSFYAHLNDICDIKVGKVVRKGEVIAHAGTSGNARGFKGEDQHLHFECRTSPGHQLGLGGKENPNNIVATKFTPESLKSGKR